MSQTTRIRARTERSRSKPATGAGWPWSLGAVAALATLIPAALLSGCGGGGGGGSDLAPISLGIAAADFNRDGRIDLAQPLTPLDHGPPHASSVGVQLQGGTGTLDPAQSYAVGDDSWNIIAADVNDDGLPDIVSVDVNSETLSVLINDSGQPGHFRPAITLPTGSSPSQVVAYDLDGDGHTDLIEAHEGGVGIHLQNASAPGTFAAGVVIDIANCCFGVAVGDLNNDGLADIAVTSADGVLVLLQDRANPGSFGPPTAPVAGAPGSWIVVADVNGDGAADLIYTGPPDSSGSSSSVVVALQNPANPGHFFAPSSYPTAGGVFSFLLRDINGDGIPDLVVGGSVGLTFLLQDAANRGHFLSPQIYNPSFQDSAGDRIYYDFSFIDVADINGDGLPDILVSSGPSADGPGVMYQIPGSPGSFDGLQDLH